MKKITFLVLVIFLLISNLYSKEKIKWLVWELVPEFIKSGPEAGNGYADKFTKSFQKRLPEYEHEVVWLNTRRWFSESSKYGHCTTHIWKKFKLNEQYYSKAYTLTSPHGILIHKKNINKFPHNNGVVSIKKILQDDSLVLSVPVFDFNKDRYPVLKQYIQPYIGKKNLQEVITNTNEVSPKMLDLDRSDYLITYPTTAEAYSRMNNTPNEYIFYYLEEDPYYKKIHVACDKSELGKTVIDKINNMLDEDLFREFLSYHEEWNNKDEQFSKRYINYFINGIDDPFIKD